MPGTRVGALKKKLFSRSCILVEEMAPKHVISSTENANEEKGRGMTFGGLGEAGGHMLLASLKR